MNRKQYILIGLLILGLVFSSMIGIYFNLSEGFEYHGIWFKVLPFKLMEYRGNGSSELELRSMFIGYLFYLVYGLLLIKDLRINMRWMVILFGFIIMTAHVTYFDCTSFIQDYNSEFNGQYLRNGPVIFLLGFVIFIKYRGIQKTIKK